MTLIIPSVISLLLVVYPISGYLPEFEVVFSEAQLTVARVASLDHHNLRRCMHNAPPLALDHKLNLEAQDYAERLARENRFEHSYRDGMGENIGEVSTISKASSTPLDVTTMVLDISQAFYKEWVNYTGSAAGAGHFTALVWKNTKFLGVGVAANTHFDPKYPSYPLTKTLIVANYQPPGNVGGLFSENVEGRASKTEEECRRVLRRVRSGSGRNSVPIRLGIFTLALLLLTAWV